MAAVHLRDSLALDAIHGLLGDIPGPLPTRRLPNPNISQLVCLSCRQETSSPIPKNKLRELCTILGEHSDTRKGVHLGSALASREVWERRLALLPVGKEIIWRLLTDGEGYSHAVG
jgi:hypothetical protein